MNSNSYIGHVTVIFIFIAVLLHLSISVLFCILKLQIFNIDLLYIYSTV